MSEEVIERVDQMIRKNNIKYKDQQSQKAYEQALKEYQKQSKAQLAKQYAQLVKQGNRKAVQKAKAAKKSQKKQPKKTKVVKEPQQQKTVVVQVPKKKLSEAQIILSTKTIEARAQRIMQEQHLQKLNKKLQQQKKRNKLFQLNQKCKKMLSKSHERIVPARNISQDKMKILKKIEEKAQEEINDLDNMINGLIDKANQNIENKVNQQVNKATHNLQQQEQQEYDQQEYDPQEWPQDQQYNNLGLEEEETTNAHNYLDLNTLIFEKSTEELLSMDYIPL